MEALSADPLEIRRVALFARLDRVKPKIVEMLAPAGFGKSSFVRAYLRDRGGIVCDCASVRDDIDFASRLLRAIGTPDTLLHDGGLPIADRLDAALEAWENAPVEIVAFENAQALVDRRSACAFLERLLENRPAHRVVVIATRRPLPLGLTRFALPHDIMVLRAADLAFDEPEARQILLPCIDDDATLARVMAVSHGWPIVLLMFRRLAGEGRLNALLDQLDDIAFEELHAYLRGEVLAEFTPPARAALFACAVIPRASAVDLRASGVDAGTIEELIEAAKRSPVVKRDADGIFAVTPMLVPVLLRNRDEDRIAVLRSLAAAYSDRMQFARAAELFLACDDQDAAVEQLENIYALNEPATATELLRIVPSLDRIVLQRSPRVWSMSALLRRYTAKPEVLLDEAESLWRMLPPDAPIASRACLVGCRALFLGDTGLLDAGLSLLDEFEKNEPGETCAPGYVNYVRGVLLARAGRLRAGEREVQRALPEIETIDGLAAGALIALGVDIARVRGERAVERQFIERAIERAQRGLLPNYVAAYYAEGLIGAWIAGETQLVEHYAAKLRTEVERADVPALRYIASVAVGHACEPADADMAHHVVYGRLMELAASPDAGNRIDLAHAAFDAADKSGRPFCRALAALAVGLVDVDHREDFYEIARSAASQCDAPFFATAVEAVTSERMDHRMLAAFVAHFDSGRQQVTPPLEVCITRGTVAVEGRTIALSERELQLIFVLAQRREPTPRTRLIALLWPDLEESAARNALSVCVHRARAHLGRADLIVSNGDGYSLHPQARVDMLDIERVLAAVRTRNALGETHRGVLMRVWDEVRAARPAFIERWEWFATTERRLREFRAEVAHRLASDALRRGDGRAALEFAEDIIALDPCDEPAREIAIRALLHEGDRAGARRQFRQYRDALFEELQCEPSATIAALVTS